MIYQNIMLGPEPFLVFINRNTEYPVHTHYELEIVYCLSGAITAIIEGESKEINTGEAICINSMVRPGFEYNSTNAEQLVIEFGAPFIGESFHLLKKLTYNSVHFVNSPEYKEIFDCLKRIITARKNNKETDSLTIKSELLKLFVLILDTSIPANQLSTDSFFSDQRQLTLKIGNAINLVHHRYNQQISVADAAKACGFGVSAFCNSFKKHTGKSFHSYLNAYRVENSKHLLLITEMSVEQIADAVGFLDSKSFCRAFKRETGTSPGEYRKGKRYKHFPIE